MDNIFFIIVVIAIFAVAFLLSAYLVKRPVAEIIDAIRKVEKGDLKTRIITNRKDEIGLLAAGINSLISDLEKSKIEIDKYQAEEISHIEKMASIGEIAAAVAHEIKNPLAGISGALQVLAEDFPSESPRKEIANEVLIEIERLDTAVKDLLAFARPPELNLILTDINVIIEKVKEVIKVTALELNVKINPVLNNVPEIMLDPDQMEKALLNIVQNSLRSMQGGGMLTIAVSDKSDDNEIEIAISDTGGGIPEENLKDVFKPKFSTKYFGTGLGLAISRNIIENHKGRIDVESRDGIGSTFHIILPGKS